MVSVVTVAPILVPVYEPWSVEKALEWGKRQPWIVGCNFCPSTASNQLEFWQAETFDLPTIDRELGFAAGIGMNAVRAYLHDLAHEQDPEGMKERMERFLAAAARHGIRTLFVIFDDCWNPGAKPGPQPAPIPGVHNSRWLQSPGHAVGNDPANWPRLERYVKDVVSTFKSDDRILGWDVFNEPGNGGQGRKSEPLLRKAFQWARDAGAQQPLTCGAWGADREFDEIMLDLSDVLTFHCYGSPADMRGWIERLEKRGRPIICTEWLARSAGQKVEEILPILHDAKVGAMNWGLVAGKTNTKFPWGSKEGSPEPDPWFHELFYPDGKPYREAEAAVFRRLTGKG
jgi:hypothetical protein